MEGDGTELRLEKERLMEKSSQVSALHSVSVVLRPGKMDECDNNQANKQVTLSPITVIKSPTQESHPSRDINVTLENESVWSRFHGLGTEMILAKQGRRMFPCCRFRLSGLDPQKKYFLLMEIMPLDDFIHRWNGKTWEPVALDIPHAPLALGQMCVHPESPALGQQWMDSPVSFYKVKLTSDSTDQEGCVLLRPMHRYQPQLHVVPVDADSGGTISLGRPSVKIFTFPQTEFYAVTSYQNPQITQLKIDCNPFAMAFREDTQSINLLQKKLKLCSSLGTHFGSPLLSFARNLGVKRKECTVESRTSNAVEDNRVKRLYTGSASLKEGEGIFAKMRNDALSCSNNMDLSQENTDCSQSDGGNEAVVNKCSGDPVLDEHVAPLDFDPGVTVSSEERLPSTDETVPPISTTENLKSAVPSEDALNSQISCTNYGSPTNLSMAAQSPKSDDQEHKRKPEHPLRIRHCQRGRKAKSKWWSNVKYSRPRPAVVPPNAPLQPDLESVEGMLFVSFVAKEALSVHGENIKESEPALHPPSSTHEQSDNPESENVSLSVEERIANLEKSLLLHLKLLKHRQVLHPCLQDVGMKLSLLDPKLPIDLQYLGVHLPLSSPAHEGLDTMNPMSLLSSSDAAEFFVSRTGKTNDPTKIKGWRDKFKTSTVQSAPEGLKHSSAFCSEMLDAYLEKEAQQISDRVAVFSKCSVSPVSYQLPSKSSSYVVTLDSLLKTRSASSNKVYSEPVNKMLPKSSLRSPPRNAIPLSAAGVQNECQGNREKGETSEVSAFQASRSMNFVSSPGTKSETGQSQLRLNNNGGTEIRSNVCSPTIPAKVKNQMMLQELEEEAIIQGKVRTRITTMRAKFALTSLLNFQKPSERPRVVHLYPKDENACHEDFCRLGCICDSLDREIRGPTHCRRVDCMFDCNCFKHKVLLLHPPKEANVQRGRKRSVLAFPIADPDRHPRPPPASNISTLWKRTTGDDPEPLFIPEPPISSKPVPPSLTSLTHSTNQVREEDKDPVYLYFESMMTCARVREYNSNPPPQLHMFPTKKMKEPVELNKTAEAGEPCSSQNIPETNPTETPIKQGELKPTKLLEILSECNWEPHRSLVLSALFRRMNSNLLSEPFCFGMYKIRLLSTTIKEVNRSSTITYKVCISRADEKEMTEDLPLPVKKPARNQSLNGFETKVLKTNETQVQKAATDSEQMSSTLVEKRQKKPLYKRQLRAFTFTPAVGYLKADKKKPGIPAQGLIRVNGRKYMQAKLLLGQQGALHPVNRFAAFVTGRLLPMIRDKQEIEDDAIKACPPKAPLEPSSKPEVANASNHTSSNLAVASPPLASVPEPTTTSENRRSNISPLNALPNLVGPAPSSTPIVPDGSRFVLVPVMTSNSTAAPSPDIVTSSTLPPGQQVVLQPASRMSGLSFLCQYNGRMIQLKPINPGPLVQPQPSSVSQGSTSQVMQTAYNAALPKDTGSLQTPLNSTPLTKVLPNPFSVTAPKVLSLSAKSGMNIANGMPAFNLQSSFPGKTGTFCFRICPPTGEGKPVGSEHSGKPPDSSDSPSTLILPGGFTLIRLIHPAVPAVPAVPTNVTSAASHPVEIPQNNESMQKSSSESCSSSLQQNYHVSESITSPPLPETSNCNSAQGVTAGLSPSSNDIPSEGVIKDELVNDLSESVIPGKDAWVPEGAEMVHTSDLDELESTDMDDWPPNGAERILWLDSGDEEENEDLSEELNKNLDVTAGNPAAEEASESKTTTTGTLQADFSNSDKSLHADKLYFNEKEAPKNHPSHEDGLSPEDVCSESSHADEQKLLKSSVPSNDQEKACDPSLNEANSEIGNISKQKSPSSVLISSPNTIEQAMIQEDCASVVDSFIENEPYNESTEKDMSGNEPDTKDQGLLLESSTLQVSKIKAYNSQTGENTLLNHFHIDSAKNYGVSNQIQSCSDSPKVDIFSVRDVTKPHIGSENILPLISKEELSVNQTVTEFSSDLSNQGLGFENSSQVLSNKECYNNPSKPSVTASLHAEDSHENMDIDGNASCSLLHGQTPVKNSPTECLPSTGTLGQKTGLKDISPLPYNVHKPAPEISDDFGNLSGDCTKTSEINRDFNEGKTKDGNRQLMSDTAEEEPCGDEEIIVDVMNLSQNEDEYSSDEFNSDEDDLNQDSEGDSYSDEDSSDDSTSDNETIDDAANTSNEADVDLESFEENDGKRIINMSENKTRDKKNAKREAKLRKIKHLSSVISTAGQMPLQELKKRQNHTEKERVRRDELRRSFATLKKALNVEEQLPMCIHDILNQARITIWALESRSQCLKERKKALSQRQTAYLRTIVELSEKMEARDEAIFRENCKHQMPFVSQNTLETSISGPPVNPRWLDSDGNSLTPRIGSWKSPNYICKRLKQALQQPSGTTTEKRSLPKIVLQSFGKTDAVKFTHGIKTSLPSSTEAPNSAKMVMDDHLDLQDQNKGMENCTATKVTNEMEKTLGSEHSNKESPTPSSAVTESEVPKTTVSVSEKDKPTSATVMKVRKKRAKPDAVIEEALSNPDVLGPRQLRQRFPAVNGEATRGSSANKGRRII